MPSEEALLLAAAQVAEENEHAANELARQREAECADEEDDQSLPACMPSPDVLVQIFHNIFAAGGSPMANMMYFVIKVALSLQSLMGVVMLGAAIGAWTNRPDFALPSEMQQLVSVAGNLAGLSKEAASVLIPAAAGIGQFATILAFWFSSPIVEHCATVCLIIMFGLVAYVHHAAGVSVLSPTIFMLLAVLKVCIAPGRKQRKLD